MIFNIQKGTFGDCLRNGDLVAVGNVVEYLRKKENNKNIKFFLSQDSMSSADFCKKFYSFLNENTDYFSLVPGNSILPWKRVNLWDFRAISQDLVKIKNTKEAQNKIVVFPLFNAPYNTYRNWPIELFISILSDYEKNYPNHERIVCLDPEIKIGNLDQSKWKVNTDFNTAINHIMESEIFVGGDTGTSHFAAALDRGPNCVYYYSGRGLLHTTPFHLFNGKGKMVQYWGDFEGTTWT